MPSTKQWALADDTVTSNVPMNEISLRAFRNFKKNYGVVPYSQWRKGPEGYVVTFYDADSVQYYLYYTIQGGINKTVVPIIR